MVCGCSYSAPSNRPQYKGSAWGELLAKKLKWDVEILARQGCSNGAIRIQIDEVIRQKPTFAIIIPTFYDRIEIPVKQTKFDFNNNTIWQKLQLFLRTTNKDDSIGYDFNAGLDNINYSNNNYRMVSEMIYSLANNMPNHYRKNELDTSTQNAIKEYVNNIYDPLWKQQIDRWIIRDGLVQLKYANIPFLVVPGTKLWETAKILNEDLNTVLDEKYLWLDDTTTPVAIQETHRFHPNVEKHEIDWANKDPGYHTSVVGQAVLANKYYEVIKNRWNLV